MQNSAATEPHHCIMLEVMQKLTSIITNYSRVKMCIHVKVQNPNCQQPIADSNRAYKYPTYPSYFCLQVEGETSGWSGS